MLKYKADMTVLLGTERGFSVNFARQIVQHVIDATVDDIIKKQSIGNSAAAKDEFQRRFEIAQGKKTARGQMYAYIVQLVEETSGSFYAALVRHQDEFVEVSRQLGEEINASNSQAEFQPGARFGNLQIEAPPPSVVAANRVNADSNMPISEQYAAQFEVWNAIVSQGTFQVCFTVTCVDTDNSSGQAQSPG